MFVDMITRFDTIHERDRQQDRQTDGRTDRQTLHDGIGRGDAQLGSYVDWRNIYFYWFTTCLFVY